MLEQAMQAASLLVQERFPDCLVAILGGSIVRGEGTDHSDLDIFVLDPNIPGAYRESLVFNGRPVEVFVHTMESYKTYFETDSERARPSLPQMVVEGKILIDYGVANGIKREAQVLLEAGPKPWTETERQLEQYGLTDLLDDFEGSRDRMEDIFIAGKLAEKAHEFYLRMNKQWVGSGKWILRALRRYDPRFADRFAEAFHLFYVTGEKKAVINMIDQLLKPYGGRLFEGFTMGKSDS